MILEYVFTKTSYRQATYKKIYTIYTKSHPPKPHIYLQSRANASISRLRLIVRIEKQGVATRPPAIRIPNTPNRNTHAVGNISASLDRSRILARIRTLDIQLSDRALGSDSAQVAHGLRNTTGLTLRKMALGADAVDGDTVCDPLADLGDHALGFAVGGGVEVVVVDVEFGGGVGLASSFEGDVDELGAEDVVEDGGAVAAILRENLVENILYHLLVLMTVFDSPIKRELRARLFLTYPSIYLPLITTHDGLDMGDHDVLQSRPVVNGRDPAGQLGMPNRSVATDSLSVGGGPVDEVVGLAPVVGASRGLERLPFHAIPQ